MKLQNGSGATLTASRPVETITEDLLQKISHLLAEKAAITSDLRLPMGRAGIALFLFHYYKFSEKEAYYNKAYELLDQAYEYISGPTIPVHRAARPQLGWLFMYLQKRDFIDINTDEVLGGTDVTLCNACTQDSLKPLSNGYVTDIGAYLVERYQNTGNRFKRIKIEESLINMVDEIRLLYPLEIKEKIIAMCERGQITAGWSLNNLLRTTCNLCMLLAKIAETGIYKQIIIDTLSEINETVIEPIFHNQPLRKSLLREYAGYATLAYALVTQTWMRPWLKNSITSNAWDLISPAINPDIYSDRQTSYVGDLLLTISCLWYLNGTAFDSLLTEEIRQLISKLSASVNKNAACDLNFPVGIPDLGLKDGLAGAGMALLSALQDELLITPDIMFITIK